jgi:hypothetical protein
MHQEKELARNWISTCEITHFFDGISVMIAATASHTVVQLACLVDAYLKLGPGQYCTQVHRLREQADAGRERRASVHTLPSIYEDGSW